MATLQDLKLEIGGGREDADAQLRRLLAAATSFVEEQLGWKLGDREQEVLLKDGEGRYIVLPNQPHLVVDLVEVREEYGATWTELVADADYEHLVYPRCELLHLGGQWPQGAATVRVTVTRGFDKTNPIPPAVDNAVVTLASHLYRTRKTTHFTSDDPAEQITSSRVPTSVWQMLRPFKRVF